ncbi:MAG: hypothetical protein L0Z53_13740 [Acidobacteriales bacterium]|nr:hypothetical protein [Terriglobales bacterium]
MTYFKYLILGVAISVLLLLILSSFPRQAVLYFLTLFLAATAASYAGAALAERRSSRTTRLETAAFVAVFASALAGLLVSPRWIAVGYAAHGLWDLLHLSHNLGVEVAKWFPPVCPAFDLLVAAFILGYF